ncbi:CBS domain-containing protein [Saccharothrix obliqua]|uniref:CBS domain-containing protein n=1 Tax=Saccharothrix obliqua TaxID=2861747 RepID=UPI001C5D2212|nr:CBS domain-containing protein [Saccharothrix obliqua]MBW4717903.1 CBS domain-containing protein [Saccharothrix obliqua]
MRARDIMTSPVITVTPDVPIREAAALMVSHGFTALPVVDDDRLVAIVTEADLLHARYGDHESAATPVREVMLAPVWGMDPDAPAELLAQVMVVDRVRCVPVVDGSRLVGVVTRRDLVRALARTDASIAADVRERLDAYGGSGRWPVSVYDGEALVRRAPEDKWTSRVVSALAETVPGVMGVRLRTEPDGEPR